MNTKEQELQAALEAMIYAADEPATLEQLASVAGAEKDAVRGALERLMEQNRDDARGVEIRKVANGYKMYTKAEHHDAVRRFIKSLRPPLRLSLPALETLAVIAYKQPATVPEINEIRGVNCAGVIGTLLERRLITTAGRKEVVGRPILYRTSKEFLMRFGLADVDDLPSLKEFEQLAQSALDVEEGGMVEAAVSAEDAEVLTGEMPAATDAGEAFETAAPLTPEEESEDGRQAPPVAP